MASLVNPMIFQNILQPFNEWLIAENLPKFKVQWLPFIAVMEGRNI